jgi:hypothetical protein
VIQPEVQLVVRQVLLRLTRGLAGRILHGGRLCTSTSPAAEAAHALISWDSSYATAHASVFHRAVEVLSADGLPAAHAMLRSCVTSAQHHSLALG